MMTFWLEWRLKLKTWWDVLPKRRPVITLPEFIWTVVCESGPGHRHIQQTVGWAAAWALAQAMSKEFQVIATIYDKNCRQRYGSYDASTKPAVRPDEQLEQQKKAFCMCDCTTLQRRGGQPGL